MKQNIEFYPHYATADQHSKFKMLRVQFGWEGEGKFWALNNRIALSENCCLDISKKYNKAAIANDLNLTLEKFDEFINFLIDECELVKSCDNGFITTDIIQETFAKVMGERDKARARHRRASGEKDKVSGEKIDKGKESRVEDNRAEKSRVGSNGIEHSIESSVVEKKDLPPFSKNENEEQDQLDDFYLTKNKKKLSGKRFKTFMQFWDAFAYKSGKAEAADAWLDIPKLTNDIVGKIIAAAKIEAQNRPAIRANGNNPKMGQGWLSGRRWEDEGIQQEPKKVYINTPEFEKLQKER